MVLDDNSEEKDTAPPCTCLHVINIHHYVNATIVAKQHQHTSLANPVEKNDDRLLINIDVQPIDDDPSSSASNKWQDINNFFSQPVITEENGKMKKHCACTLCPYVLLIPFNSMCSHSNS